MKATLNGILPDVTLLLKLATGGLGAVTVMQLGFVAVLLPAVLDHCQSNSVFSRLIIRVNRILLD